MWSRILETVGEGRNGKKGTMSENSKTNHETGNGSVSGSFTPRTHRIKVAFEEDSRMIIGEKSCVTW